MELGYGLITCQRYFGDGRTATDLYHEALELCRECETVGLDSAWTSEHHFWDDDYMPSLLVMSAAIAATTQRLTIGTGVLLAPLYHPLRLAEDAATVQLISKGRLILGLGIGWRQEEFERLGVPVEGLGRRMSETIKVLRLAWGAEPFEFDGRVFSFGPTNVTPKPSAPIPIWVGAFVDEAIRRAGRLADGYLGSATVLDDVARRAGLVREALEKAGREPSQFTFAVHEPVWVGDAEEIVPYMDNSRWKYDDLREAFGRPSNVPLPKPPPLDEARAEWIKARLISGDTRSVAEQIMRFREAAGSDIHFIARSYYPGVPFERARQAIKDLGEVKRMLG